MHVTVEILSLYALYGLSATLLIGRFGEKDRASTIVVAWLLPFLFVAAIITVAIRIVPPKARMGPCPHGLEEAEMLVARRRQEMFGGELRPTRYAMNWRLQYGMMLDMEARTVQKFARRILAHA